MSTLPAICPTCGSDDPEFDRFHGCFGDPSCDAACERCEDAYHAQPVPHAHWCAACAVAFDCPGDDCARPLCADCRAASALTTTSTKEPADSPRGDDPSRPVMRQGSGVCPPSARDSVESKTPRRSR
jgi:hypothetical protein